MATIDRRGATVGATDPPVSTDPNPDLAIKAPVRAATTGGNIALSGLFALDGLTLAAGDRVLVKDETDATTNGIYNASTGAWTRSVDAANNSQWATGTLVTVTAGSANAGKTYQLTTVAPVLGVSAMTFSLVALAAGNFVGDSGSGGAAGLVPAPPAGSAALHKFLGAGGTFVVVPTMVGDSGAGGIAGLVPAPGAGAATKFLRGDGTFAAISGAGVTGLVSIVDLGADPTGVADSTAAIQAALTLGGFIIVPAGSYLILGTPVATKPCYLLGAGASIGNADGLGASIFFTANDGAHTLNDLLHINSDGVTVEGIAFNGLGSRQVDQNHGAGIAVGTDYVTLTDGAITSTSRNFSSVSANFTANSVGNYINVTGAGATGAPLFSTIATFTDAQHVVLTDAASSTVTGATALYGKIYTGAIVRRCSFIAQSVGIHFVSAQKWIVDSCYLDNFYDIQIESKLNPDAGDNRISGTTMLADTVAGHCIEWTSGGGLWITNHCKFLQAWRHVNQSWSVGISGEFTLEESSCEGFGAGGCLAFTCAAAFTRYTIVGNNFGGGSSTVIAFDNAGAAVASEILIDANIFDSNSATNVVDIGKVNSGIISGNQLNSPGGNTAIKLESNAQAIYVTPTNKYVGFSTNVADSGTGNSIGTTAGEDLTYSSGAWTPTLVGTGTAGAPTYSIQKGSYEKIGRQVTVRYTIAVSALGGPTTSMQVGGLPFSSANVSNDNGGGAITYMSGVTLDASYTQLAGIVAPNTNLIALYELGSGQSGQAAPVGKFSNSTVLEGFAIYHV